MNTSAGSLCERSALMAVIRDVIKRNDWNQKQAALVLGCHQPRISNLLNSHTKKFSIGMLIDMLQRLGFSFEFKYSPSSDEILKIKVNSDDVVK